MTPTELLCDEIIELTNNGRLKWHAISRAAHSDVMPHPERVHQQFKALWWREDAPWTLLFVDKRHRERLHPLFGMSDVHAYELFILENDKRIRKLDKWVLAWGHLCALAATIRHRLANHEAEELSANS